MAAKIEVPTPFDVIAFRCAIAEKFGLGITEAQDRCAAMAHKTRRGWQNWERGEKKADLAAWELVNIKYTAQTK